jgi:predicted transposase YbfD/YdcC
LLTRLGALKRDGEQTTALCGEQQVHLALDGKTLRGTLGHTAADQKKMHQLTLYDTQTGVLLKEQVTGEKQHELSIVSQFLTPVLVKGRIISADALHTQHTFCFSVTRWDGDFVLIAKDNQATLADDLRLFFSEPPHDCRDWRTARTVNKGHGRLEIRELVASTELNEFLGGQWAGVAQVFQLTRTVSEDGQIRREVVYGITSLSPARASAARILALVRAHWRIENRLRLLAGRDTPRRSLSSPQGPGSSHLGAAQQFSVSYARFLRR